MHSQRLSRQFEKTLHQLREIQAERRDCEEHELSQAADLVESHQLNDQPYDPNKDGFVFSDTQIDNFIHRRDRDHRAYQAATEVRRARA
jgi:hypothetical protein